MTCPDCWADPTEVEQMTSVSWHKWACGRVETWDSYDGHRKLITAMLCPAGRHAKTAREVTETILVFVRATAELAEAMWTDTSTCTRTAT